MTYIKHVTDALAVVAFQDDFSSDNGTMIPYLSDVTVAGGVCTIDPNLNNAYTGAFSRMGGYSTDFGLGFWASIDVYLDVNIPDQNGFDLSMALNKTDGDHAQDFIFHVGKIASELRVNANNNSDFAMNEYVINTGNSGAYGVIPASGWYTFKITWVKDDPNIDVTFEVIDDSGSVIWTLNRPTTHTPIAQVGGNRYLWFCYHDIPLQVDNLILQPFTEAPQGSTHAAKNVTATSADLSGAVVYNGYDNCQCRYRYWAEGGSVMTTDWTNIGLCNFTLVTGLTPNTTYTYKIEIKNSVGSYLAAYARSFTTLSRIAISSTDGGTVTAPGEGSFEYDGGTVIGITAVADAPYGFAGWAGSAVDAGLVADPNAAATTVQVTGDLTLVANFYNLPTAAIVVKPADLSMGFDQEQYDHLVAMGYYVTIVSQDDIKNGLFTEADANDLDLLIVSESISSSAADALIGTSTPTMHEESYGWDNWLLTTKTKSIWADGNDVNIVDANHPIVVDANVGAGLVPFFNPTNSWTTELVSALAPGAKLIAQTTVDGNDFALIFTVNKSAERVDGSPSPARIAGFSLPGSWAIDDPNAMTDEAWALWEATIGWLNPPALPIVADWTLDGTAADAVGGNDGTVLGGVSWVDGYLGQAASFDVNDPNSSIVVPSDAAWDFGDVDYSVSMMVRYPMAPSGESALFCKGTIPYVDGVSTGKRYVIFDKNGAMRFEIDDNVSKSGLSVSDANFVGGDWVNLVAVHDSVAKTLSLYANGVLQGSHDASGTGDISNGEDLYIGNYPGGGKPAQADIDDVRIYSKALTGDEIPLIY